MAGELTGPVLVLVGRYDSEISVDNAIRFSLAVPDGRVVILERSGHHPYLEETDVCAQKIAAFVAQHDGAL
jgi:pimeloyl-ACP methyl ester carboxylesterase